MNYFGNYNNFFEDPQMRRNYHFLFNCNDKQIPDYEIPMNHRKGKCLLICNFDVQKFFSTLGLKLELPE